MAIAKQRIDDKGFGTLKQRPLACAAQSFHLPIVRVGLPEVPGEGGGWFTIFLALALLVGNVYRFRVSRRLEIAPLFVSALLFLLIFVSWASWYK